MSLLLASVFSKTRLSCCWLLLSTSFFACISFSWWLNLGDVGVRIINATFLCTWYKRRSLLLLRGVFGLWRGRLHDLLVLLFFIARHHLIIGRCFLLGVFIAGKAAFFVRLRCLLLLIGTYCCDIYLDHVWRCHWGLLLSGLLLLFFDCMAFGEVFWGG